MSMFEKNFEARVNKVNNIFLNAVEEYGVIAEEAEADIESTKKEIDKLQRKVNTIVEAKDKALKISGKLKEIFE